MEAAQHMQLTIVRIRTKTFSDHGGGSCRDESDKNEISNVSLTTEVK